jgi:signal transduction histidine kinase
MSFGADVTRFIDGFIPEDMLGDREARTRARMFMLSHTFGPILGGVIPIYLLFIDPTGRWKLVLLAGSIFSFWAYPFVLKYSKKYELLCYASIQNLLFAILWGCYFYGGLSSPFIPWLVTVPLLAFFYLKANAASGAIISGQIILNLVGFTVAIEVYGIPRSIAVENLAVIGMISIASAATYVSMMALYYAGILASQKEFEDEARRHMETGNELREAVEKAERAGAAKAEFLARTSHELRTPLNAVIGFSEVLLEETNPANDPQGVEDLNKIRAAGKHLLGLVNAILDLSKIEAGRMEVFAERHSLSQLLPAIVNRGNGAGRRKNVEIAAAVDPGAGEIETDAQKLEQVLNLLIDNAVRYASGGGVVVTACRATLASGECGVAISVSDCGPGIDGKLLPTLFDTFNEGQDLQHAQKGPGLGLPLARRLCRLLRGDLRVARTGAQGTQMTIELPRFYAVAALAA